MTDDGPMPAIPIAPSMREIAAHFPVETIVAVVESLVAASRCYEAKTAPTELFTELAEARDLECLPDALADQVCAELARLCRFH